MLELILIRHGQTLWNAQNRVMGRLDIPLNQVGIDQALTCLEKLKNHPIDQILCSPQQRALETIQPLAKYKNIPIEIEHRLSELRFDRWQGKVLGEISTDPVYKERRQNPRMSKHPEVETVLEVIDRTQKLLQDLTKKTGHIVCVSHMDTLKAMVTQICDLPLDDFFDFEIPNATPQTFIFENQKWKKQ